MREIKLLQSLHHPNIVQLLEIMIEKGIFYFLLYISLILIFYKNYLRSILLLIEFIIIFILSIFF